MPELNGVLLFDGTMVKELENGLSFKKGGFELKIEGDSWDEFFTWMRRSQTEQS